MPVTRVLVANRGEIAVRIMRTCRTLGIPTVAVYSDPDWNALHVLAADEAFRIGPAPALQSYLDIDVIMGAVAASGADAVHPGYGFLAENPEFARAVIAAGCTWIGPPPDVIRLLGDKVASKQLAQRASVPTVPGYDGSDMSDEALLREAGTIGYPVMVKASAGGGGKGMRAVQQGGDLIAAVEGARREARSAFGDDRVFLEKQIERPRHVEIQILMDAHGNGVFLGERECSVQRRHQKVVEESPSPVLTPALRDSMGADALRLAREAGYVNAGTVEFLLDGDRYYFLEVNTRIQVEHPVTELVTDLDLVTLQIAVARGEPLALEQSDVELEGHAVEARVYAEDPEHGFLPSAGKIQRLEWPDGPGVRVDPGVYEGFVVGTNYDPMLAKIIGYGETRREALDRLGDALARCVLNGPATNLGFLRWLLRQPEMVEGAVDITYLDRAWDPAALREDIPGDVLTALATYLSRQRAPDPWVSEAGWRQGVGIRTFLLGQADRYERVEIPGDGAAVSNGTGDSEIEYRVLNVNRNTVTLQFGHDVCRYLCTETLEGWAVARGSETFKVRVMPPPSAEARVEGATAGSDPVAPMPSTVIRVAVTAGQRVAAHQPLVVLEAMKMEHVVEAPRDAVVAEVLVGEGDLVSAGAPVVRLESL